MTYIKPEPEPEPELKLKLEPTVSHPIPTMKNFHPIPPSQIAAAPDPTTTLRPSKEKKTTPLPPPHTAKKMVTHITSPIAKKVVTHITSLTAKKMVMHITPPTAKEPNEQTHRNPSSRPVVVTRDPRSMKDIENRGGRGRRRSQGRGGGLGDGGGGWGMKDGNSRNTVDEGKVVNVDIGQQHTVDNDGQGGVRKEGSHNPERGGVVKREEEEEEAATAATAAAVAGGESLRGTALLQSAALQSHLKLKSATKRKRTITDQGGTMDSQLPSSSATITSSTQHPLASRTAGDTSLRPQRPAIAKKPARKKARHVTS
jgi:hypothetical protein